MSRIALETLTRAILAKTIDHSLLRPEMTDEDVRAGCELAARHHVASVCAKPSHVPLCVEVLKGSDVAVGTVIGFPHGAHLTEAKVFEAQRAVEMGATELDMVLNIGALRSGRLDDVRDDIRAVVQAASGNLVKVILENAYLTDDQKVTACRLCEEAGADFVKTSTGYAPTGATVEDIRLMRASVSDQVEVKAAGGIRTLPPMLAVIEAGAVRVGATATEALLAEFDAKGISEVVAAGDTKGY